MFKVRLISSPEIVRTVYAVKDNTDSSTHKDTYFLIYDMNDWIWMPANLYKPN